LATRAIEIANGKAGRRWDCSSTRSRSPTTMQKYGENRSEECLSNDKSRGGTPRCRGDFRRSQELSSRVPRRDAARSHFAKRCFAERAEPRFLRAHTDRGPRLCSDAPARGYAPARASGSTHAHGERWRKIFFATTYPRPPRAQRLLSLPSCAVRGSFMRAFGSGPRSEKLAERQATRRMLTAATPAVFRKPGLGGLGITRTPYGACR